MFVLDTDHLSLLEHRASSEGQRLRSRLAGEAPENVATTIISFEEQMRGWMALLSAARRLPEQIEAYRRLHLMLDNYRRINVLSFDEVAATELQRLKRSQTRVGTMDLKIAAIVLAHGATLLSRNLADFRKVPGLVVEDWTV